METPPANRSDSPLPSLDPSTLALLNSFLEGREDEERRFRELTEDNRTAEPEEGDDEMIKDMMSVENFRDIFREDWKLSQFW